MELSDSGAYSLTRTFHWLRVNAKVSSKRSSYCEDLCTSYQDSDPVIEGQHKTRTQQSEQAEQAKQRAGLTWCWAPNLGVFSSLPDQEKDPSRTRVDLDFQTETKWIK